MIPWWPASTSEEDVIFASLHCSNSRCSKACYLLSFFLCCQLRDLLCSCRFVTSSSHCTWRPLRQSSQLWNLIIVGSGLTSPKHSQRLSVTKIHFADVFWSLELIRACYWFVVQGRSPSITYTYWITNWWLQNWLIVNVCTSSATTYGKSSSHKHFLNTTLCVRCLDMKLWHAVLLDGFSFLEVLNASNHILLPQFLLTSQIAWWWL